jgi:protein-tyrosine-phosphatase
MKFVTRDQPKVDRVACPWLIRNFIDTDAELLFVPKDQVMAVAEREGALPYDVSGAEIGHHNGGSSFEAFIVKYHLTDSALLELAKIVRAADTQDRQMALEGEGLRQIATGWHLLDWPLDKRLEVGFAVYDCLYAVCQERVSAKQQKQIALFLCPHNAAKSVIAATEFNRLVEQMGWTADTAGTEPDEVVSPVVAKMLLAEGVDVSQHKPRRVTAADLENASLIISMGCTPDELGVDSSRVEQWNDIPPVSENPDGAREVIRAHVAKLSERLLK